MITRRKIFILLYFILLIGNSFGQNTPWIAYPSSNNTVYGVYHFRKSFSLDEIPDQLIIHVSADNRYNLFVNGVRVCYGPAKGDLRTYKYDVVDIARYLEKGDNVVAAQVYNGGKDKPLAFISAQTAFMLSAEDEKFQWLNSNESWKVYKNPAYKVISYSEMIFTDRWFKGFYACGGGDEVDAELFPWNWETVDFDDSSWSTAESLIFEGNAPWHLVARNIPFMDNHIENPSRIRKIEGVDLPVGKWDGKTSLLIPKQTKASVLIDFDVFTMGYPELVVSGGKNSKVKIKYAEAMYEKPDLKAHRDSVEGKTMFGVWDIFYPDGNANRCFRPLWKRAFRYIQLQVETSEYPLEIVSFQNEYSGYPYPDMATFTCDNEKLNQIFDMCLRTLRMCSGETYYDTPFYEQLSYGGDNRPISAISTYNSKDDSLLREVMRLYPQSENRETGLLKSAYPSRFEFDMGSWSMGWIQSLHDYYFMRGDSAYVLPFVNNIEKILGFYERHLDEKTGLIGTVKNQNFIDWSITQGSIPRANAQQEISQSTMLSLDYAHTLDCTVWLFRQLGLNEKAEKWENISSGIKNAVNTNCWDESEQLFRDYPDKEIYSQHTNTLAILCDLIPAGEQAGLLNRILTFEGFDEMASSYFSFFLFKAMQKTGQENLFPDHLEFWEKFVDRGSTTCGETGFESHDRSDCHAWSAHPAYFLLNSVCGVKPAGVGFGEVLISPHPGNLKFIKATMPHPKGKISIEYELRNNYINAVIILPEGLTGHWEYAGANISLSKGENRIRTKIQ